MYPNLEHVLDMDSYADVYSRDLVFATRIVAMWPSPIGDMMASRGYSEAGFSLSDCQGLDQRPFFCFGHGLLVITQWIIHAVEALDRDMEQVHRFTLADRDSVPEPLRPLLTYCRLHRDVARRLSR